MLRSAIGQCEIHKQRTPGIGSQESRDCHGMTRRLTGQVSNRIRVAGHEKRVKKNNQVTL